MRTLLVCGERGAARARARAGPEVAVLPWGAPAEAALASAGVPFTPLAELLGLPERDAADEAAMAWTKAWGKRALEEGRSFRDLVRWRGVSLWWWAELYLHHSTRAPAYVRAIETFGRLLERLRPEEVEALALPRVEAVLLGRVCTAAGILFHGARRPGAPGGLSTARVSLRSRWNTAKTVLGALKARLAGLPPPAPAEGPAGVLFLSHAAFWRERQLPEGEEPVPYEHYFDRLIPAVAADPALRPEVVAVGPRTAFRRRALSERLREWLRPHGAQGPFVHVNRYTSGPVLRAVLEATGLIRRQWRRLRRLPAMQESFSWKGVAFGDLAEGDLAATMLLQLPWAVLACEQAAEVLRRRRPAVLCLYAESSGWGRAALAAAGAQGVPTLALQHGILYPKYFSYRHDPDERDCPRPDRTAVFGEAARRFLVERGAYAPESLVLTGSPKFDELLERAASWDRAALRASLGVPEGASLVVVASRFRAIRDTHHAIGAAFPRLLRAVEELSGVWCLVKPHPAEPAAEYERHLGQVSRTRVVPPGSDLLALLHAADVLVTVESLSAVEALVLGRPVVVLEMPTHLAGLVEAGVALGVPAGGDPAPALRAALEDPAARARLEQARGRYLSELAMGVDGRATERILAQVREMASSPARPQPALSAGMVAS